MTRSSSSFLSPPSLSLWFIMVLVCFILLTLNQHFAEVLEPTAKASTINLLEVQILSLTPEVLDQKILGVEPRICGLKSPQRVLMYTQVCHNSGKAALPLLSSPSMREVTLGLRKFSNLPQATQQVIKGSEFKPWCVSDSQVLLIPYYAVEMFASYKRFSNFCRLR